MTEPHSPEEDARLEQQLEEDARQIDEIHDPMGLGDPEAGRAVREMGEKRTRS